LQIDVSDVMEFKLGDGTGCYICEHISVIG